MKALFVDDDQSICDLLMTLCDSLGMEFEIAHTADDALRYLRKGGFGLCVTDLSMPIMDGVVLARIIREQFPDIAVYAFTGESGRYSLNDLKSNFDKVFLKPSDYSRMIGEAIKCLAIKKYPFLA